jgi:hypothetical protein
MSASFFLVSCKRCKRPVATVARLDDHELARLRTHLCACRPDEHLDDLGMEATLRHVRVTEAAPA